MAERQHDQAHVGNEAGDETRRFVPDRRELVQRPVHGQLKIMLEGNFLSRTGSFLISRINVKFLCFLKGGTGIFNVSHAQLGFSNAT